MYFSEEDIEKLTDSYKKRLQQATKQLKSKAPSLCEIQDWMQKENIENPEVLEVTISKLGKGEKVEKKMSRVSRKNKKSRNKDT